MSGDRWNPEEIETLKALSDEGASIAEMAFRLPGRSPHSINRQLQRHCERDSNHRWTMRDLAFLRHAWSIGEPAGSIATNLDVSIHAVRRKAFVMKLKRQNRRQWTRGEQAHIEALVDRLVDQIARQFNAAKLNAVHRIIKALFTYRDRKRAESEDDIRREESA